MNRWLLASIAVLVVLLGFFWFTSTERGQAPLVPASVPEPRAPEAIEPVAAPPSASPEPVLAEPEPAPATRESKSGVSADELSRAVWVDGRVLFSDGTPLDEEATIEARGKKFDDGSRQRAKVASDGSFRVAFAERSKSGWLALTARYAYLSKPQRWKKDDPAAILLTPELGGRIAGRLRLPEGAREEPGGQVTCSPVKSGGDASFAIVGSPTSKPGRGLEFAFDALPPGVMRLQYEGESYWAKDATATVERGATSTIELELLHGANLAGHVVDGNGAPLAGVQVAASFSSENQFNERSATSATDGSFRIRAVSPPKARLKGSLAGHVSVRLDVDGLREGEERADLELVFRTGTTISGRVTWPDGKPARAEVRIAGDKEDASRSSGDYFDGVVLTGGDGAFRLTGLEPGIYSVRAGAEKDGEKTRPFSASWKAEARGVAGGTQGIELVLREGLEQPGRVTDERGAPIRGATVVLRPKEEQARSFENVAFAATDRDGAFTLRGLHPGTWRGSVSGDGYVSVQDLEVEIPASAPLIVLLEQGASVTGLVLDEQGTPVPAASVRGNLDQGPGAFDECDEHGAFRLRGLARGRVTLSASGQDFADSEPLELELAAAEARRDVVLQVRRAGRIAGEVVDVGGEPLGGARVAAGGKSAQCGPDGRFELTGLVPGEVQVMASNSDIGLRLSAQVTVIGGETAHVRLQKPESFVHMHGIVRVAGDPAAGASVMSQERETKQLGPWCSSAKDGGYALELPKAGAYWIGVGPAGGSTHLWLAVDVPRCSDFAHDLELSLGRVSGRVRAQDGSPLSGVRVEAKQTSDKTSASGWGRVTTDERGEYELVLPAATYELAAGGDGGDADPARSFARTAVAEIAVVNRSHLRGIDFELAEGGTIEGVVRWGDGSPGADAQLWIGPQGKTVESSSLGKADAHGHFHVEGVGAGKVVVTATLGLGTAEWKKLEVKPGSVLTVELALAASESLEVRVLDRGTAVAAEVHAADEKGKDYGSVADAGPIARIGPLPAGRYRVTARLGERTASAEITLTGKQATSKLEILLP